MRRLTLLFPLIAFSAVALAEVSEKIQKKLDAADEAYKSAVDKADNTRFYAVQKAHADRVKVLRQALIEATKAGDFEGASKLKDLVDSSEAGSVRSKPKDVVKFGGHEYAILVDKATWHSAKTNCEAMGGHLVTFENSDEQTFVLQLCRKVQADVWIGLSNEKDLKWAWISGEPARLDKSFRLDDPQRDKLAGSMMYFNGYGTFTDWNLGAYNGYVCEWDK